MELAEETGILMKRHHGEPIPTDLQQLSADNFNEECARHLVNRAGFGATPQQVSTLAAGGLHTATETLVNYESQPSAPVLPDDFDRNLMPPLSDDERNQLQKARRASDETTVERLEKKENQAKSNDRQQLAELKKWWIARMIESARPLEEKMTLFWHGHFASGGRTVEDSWHMFQQNQLFRSFATGNFGMLVLNVIRDPAMIKYLDNDKSRKGRANENLARELLEIFILGEGHGYSESDIKEGARALTGYTFQDDDFTFREGNHDGGPKSIFGQSGNWNGDEFARLALSRKESSEFLCGKLYRFFVNDTPEEDLAPEARTARGMFIAALAAEFRDEHYELKPLFLKLFRSAHFYHQSNRGCVIKSPLQVVVQTIRQFSTPVRHLSALASACDLMGQDLFQPPNVKGWDGGRTWINTSTLFVRQNVSVYLITGKRPEVYDWEVDDAPFACKQLVNNLDDPKLLVEQLLKISLAMPAHPERRAALISFAQSQTTMTTEARMSAVLALVTALPEYQLS